MELKLPNKKENEREHEFKVLLKRRITFSKLEGGSCLLRPSKASILDKGEKRWTVFEKKIEMRIRG